MQAHACRHERCGLLSNTIDINEPFHKVCRLNHDPSYCCPLCPFATLHKPNVYQHMARSHKNEMTQINCRYGSELFRSLSNEATILLQQALENTNDDGNDGFGGQDDFDEGEQQDAAEDPNLFHVHGADKSDFPDMMEDDFKEFVEALCTPYLFPPCLPKDLKDITNPAHVERLNRSKQPGNAVILPKVAITEMDNNWDSIVESTIQKMFATKFTNKQIEVLRNTANKIIEHAGIQNVRFPSATTFRRNVKTDNPLDPNYQNGFYKNLHRLPTFVVEEQLDPDAEQDEIQLFDNIRPADIRREKRQEEQG
ncbi:mitosis inducer protein kinase cdr2 [Acrasis kona]|uniref:Mitosis inducer protein kinase cdr2 n=1 Tax=Acrasis kona TaxID=1008807 RepID=A0AAW2YL04_9EUKA